MEEFYKMIIINVVIFLILCILISWGLWGNWQGIISLIGSVASVQGVFLAFLELRKVKKSAEAVMDKISEVAKVFSYADVERHIEMCSYVSVCIHSGQYEAAAVRLSDVKKVLTEIKTCNIMPQNRTQNIQDMIRSLGVDIVAIREKIQNNTDVDFHMIQRHVNTVSTYLQEVSAVLKEKVYVE